MWPPLLLQSPLHDPQSREVGVHARHPLWSTSDIHPSPSPFACPGRKCIRAVLQDALKDMSSNRVNPWKAGHIWPASKIHPFPCHVPVPADHFLYKNLTSGVEGRVTCVVLCLAAVIHSLQPIKPSIYLASIPSYNTHHTCICICGLVIPFLYINPVYLSLP